MAAGNQSNGWEMQSGSDTCQGNILRSGSVMQRLQAFSGKGALPAAGRWSGLPLGDIFGGR